MRIGKERLIKGGEKRKERRERGGLDNVIPPSQEMAQTINERAQWRRRGDR